MHITVTPQNAEKKFQSVYHIAEDHSLHPGQDFLIYLFVYINNNLNKGKDHWS